jgi:methionyl-tRNA formyltransferase
VPQATREMLRHAPKIFTDTCKIDWNKPVDEIHNLIRGLSPHPGAFTYLQDKLFKIYTSKKEYAKPAVEPGQVETDKKSFLKFAAADGYIYALEVQPEGRKRMPVEDFLRGYRG